MKHGYLSDFFDGVGAKRLAVVDADPTRSNQHEVTGSDPLLRILGREPRKQANRFDATYIWMGSEQDAITETGKLSWYDSRERDHSRSPEWRLYYQTNAVTSVMRPGNTLFLAKQTDGRLFFIVVPPESTIERQLLWLFGITAQLSIEFAPQMITRENAAALDFTARYILDELGIEFEDPNANSIDTIIERFGTIFPSTAVFSDLARQTLLGVDARDDPDAALLAWLQHEEAMFRRLEHRVVSSRLEDGFRTAAGADVDGFIRFSLGVQNRRKSRMGRALENHLDAVFRQHDLRFVRQGLTERGNTADFLFPGDSEYSDPAWSPNQLAMLAAKSSCKDRWRQVLPEADRIPCKHLATLEPAISPAQTDQMAAHGLQLVIPSSVQDSYQPRQKAWLWTIADFIDHIRRFES